MSNEAINWAFAQPIKHSTAKFVLVVMANHAPDGDWVAFPSIASLAEATGQDRKTVLENIKRLAALGYISDTGARKGATKQVPVYRLNTPENGTVEEAQKRDSTENGTVPKFLSNSPVFPHKQSQNSLVTVPKTGHGIINNHQGTNKEPKALVVKTGLNVTVPDWIPADAWLNWTEYRKAIKAPLTTQAAKLCIAKLELLKNQGSAPQAVIDQSIMSGRWTGLFPIKPDQLVANGAAPKKDWE